MDRDIVFVNSLFPCLSETFVYDQFTALRHAGLHFHIVSNHRPAPDQIHPRMRAIEDEVLYLAEASWQEVLAAHTLALRRHPVRYLRSLCQLPFSAEPLRTAVAQLSGAALILRRFGQRHPLHLHVHFTYGAAAVALWTKRLSGTPYSLTVHGSDLIFDSPADLRKRLREACCIVSISEYNRRYLAEHYPEIPAEKIHLIRMGIPPGQTSAKRPKIGGTLRILNVGRLSVHKAQHDLITACAQLRDRGIDFTCTIVGEGELRPALARQITDLNLDGHVTLAGARYHDQVLALYAEYDVFVLSSITEGQPIVLMEAMRAGIPIIATKISAIPELLGACGTLVAPDSPDQIRDALLDFQANPAEYQARARQGENILHRDYDLQRNHLRFKDLLNGLISTNTLAPAKQRSP